MKSIPIAIACGDGIGPEIMKATLSIFKASKVPLSYHPVEMGHQIYLSGHSNGMTPEAKKIVESHGILFKGPMATPKGYGVKSINVTARKVWNTFANKRVFRSYPGIDTVFSKAGVNVMLTLVRENIEDTYGAIEHFQTGDVAQCRRLITRPGCHQVHRYAFELASRNHAKRLTCGHKANIMKLTDGLFLESFYEIAKEFPNIKVDDCIVDDLAMKLVVDPQQFDIIVLPNLQGDIISDLCAGLVGGLGMAPSANIGRNVSIFEAVHGTAPDIAGKNLANPTALILSGLMMLRHVGLNDHAEAIHSAVVKALVNGQVTADLAHGRDSLTTDQFADAVISHLPCTDKFTVNGTYTTPAIPEENILRVINKEPIRNVGVDLFIDSDNSPNTLAQIIESKLPPNFKLVMISNRGTVVWPTCSLFTELVNHYRARIEFDGAGEISQVGLLDVAKILAQSFRICSLEMLIDIGDRKGYSLAQGQ